MPLAALDLTFCQRISDAGLRELREAPLTDLSLFGCQKVTNVGVGSLVVGKPLDTLAKLDISNCKMVSDGILPILVGLPLVYLIVSRLDENHTLTSGDFSDGGLNGLIQAVPTFKEVRVKVTSYLSHPISPPEVVLYGRASMAGPE